MTDDRHTTRIDDELMLTSIHPDLLAQLEAAINDEDIAKNTISIPYPYNKQDALDFYHLASRRRAAAGYPLDYSIIKNGKLIGGIGLVCQEGFDSHRTEFGYWIEASERNGGTMTRVIGHFVDYVFTNTNFIRLEAHTFCDNVPSQIVLEKNGFVREGLLRKFIRKENSYKDVYAFSRIHPSFN